MRSTRVMVERWQDLKHAVFGERAVADGAGVVALDAPSRAQDAALVPITVTLPHPEGAAPADRIKSVYILVDGNPAPLAGTFHFGPEADPHSLKLRVRVDQYTLMHAVAETEDGRLFESERFVKAAGGCSAPSMKDPGFAMSRIGKMRIKMDPGVSAVEGQPATAQLMIIHPNNNGMQVDQISHNFIPPRYIQEVDVRYGDQQVFKARRRHLAQRRPGHHLWLHPGQSRPAACRIAGQHPRGIPAGIRADLGSELITARRTIPLVSAPA